MLLEDVDEIAARVALLDDHVTPIGSVVEQSIADRVCDRRVSDVVVPLGHRDLKTTMIYTHVALSGPKGVTSPADRL